MVIFHSYVSLPEGNPHEKPGSMMAKRPFFPAKRRDIQLSMEHSPIYIERLYISHKSQ